MASPARALKLGQRFEVERFDVTQCRIMACLAIWRAPQSARPWLRARQRSIAVSGLPVLLGRSEQPPALAVEGLDGLLNHLNVTSFEPGLPQGVGRVIALMACGTKSTRLAAAALMRPRTPESSAIRHHKAARDFVAPLSIIVFVPGRQRFPKDRRDRGDQWGSGACVNAVTFGRWPAWGSASKEQS